MRRRWFEESPVFRLLFWSGVAGIIVLSVTPQVYLPPTVVFWDKLQHFLAYAVLSGVGRQAYAAKKYASALFLGLIALGGALEITQAFIPGRLPSFGDAVANALGVGAGLLTVGFGLKFIGRRSET